MIVFTAMGNIQTADETKFLCIS